MRKNYFVLFAMGLLLSTAGMAQKTKIVNSGTVSSANKYGAEISRKGHIDFLIIGKDGPDQVVLPIPDNLKANYCFEVYKDPTDKSAPSRRTAMISCDIDWKGMGIDTPVPVDWSWSGKSVVAAIQDAGSTKQYAVTDGGEGVFVLLPDFSQNGSAKKTLVFLYGGGNQFSGLKQGMYVDDVARQIQAEIPGTRVVITGNVRNGLTEYVLLSFGEKKVYDVTGDYHYSLTNDEPYFTFWFDSKNNLVSWFKLK